MFRVKICGVTSPHDARLALEAGADAVGLNFYEKSPRWVPRDEACKIADAIRDWTARAGRGPARIVGVFVNAESAEVARCCRDVGLTDVQLHGDEPATAVAAAAEACGGEIGIVRAVRVPGDRPDWLAELLAEWGAAGRVPDVVLVDAAAAGEYGGTGQTADWEGVGRLTPREGGFRLVLAGGLKPGNVAEAIRTARPFGVDTASGVESAPGVKDAEMVGRFVREARAALGCQ